MEKIQRMRQKFRLATPAVRREALIEASFRCLKKYGHRGRFRAASAPKRGFPSASSITIFPTNRG